MKKIKRELDAVARNLKTLTKKAESIVEMLGKMAASESPERKKAKVPAKSPGKPEMKPKKAPAVKGRKATASDAVLGVITRSKKGIDTAGLKEKTGFNDTKVRNVVFRLKKQGKIKTEKKGLYVSA